MRCKNKIYDVENELYDVENEMCGVETNYASYKRIMLSWNESNGPK